MLIATSVLSVSRADESAGTEVTKASQEPISTPEPLVFNQAPLAMVARILSARLNVPLTVETGAQRPVSGDYRKMDLRDALADAARQTGLTVAEDTRGDLRLIEMKSAQSAVTNVLEAVSIASSNSEKTTNTDRKKVLHETTAKRLELLQRRKKLLEESGR